MGSLRTGDMLYRTWLGYQRRPPAVLYLLQRNSYIREDFLYSWDIRGQHEQSKIPSEEVCRKSNDSSSDITLLLPRPCGMLLHVSSLISLKTIPHLISFFQKFFCLFKTDGIFSQPKYKTRYTLSSLSELFGMWSQGILCQLTGELIKTPGHPL